MADPKLMRKLVAKLKKPLSPEELDQASRFYAMQAAAKKLEAEKAHLRRKGRLP